MSVFPIAAALQAGGSILGSILNKPKVISPRQNILSTVKGAREAGVHPLAALGASPSYQTVSGGVGDAVAGGISKVAAALATEKSQGEIDALAASTDANKAQAELFRAQSRTLIARSRSAAIGGPRVNDDPQPVKAFGGTLMRDPKMFSSAQRAQDEYGDFIENLVGIPSAIWAGARGADRWLSKLGIPNDAEVWEAIKRWSRAKPPRGAVSDFNTVP